MIQEKNTLTVCVPCFNTSEYIRKCVDSILEQTYNDLNIFLIDDGSTDETGSILDEYVTKDSRIAVVHQRNIGLSLTRKKCLELCKTKFITFVDSDDWIHPRMYEIMMSALLKEEADISVCGACDAYQNDDVVKCKHRYTESISDTYEIKNRVDATLMILDDVKWNSYFWNKIYNRDVFNGINFIEGMTLDEDLCLMHLIFDNSHKVVFNESEMYYYRHRENSICSSRNEKSIIKKCVDRSFARFERYKFVKKNVEYESSLNKMANIALSVYLASLRMLASIKSFNDLKYQKVCIENIKSIELSSFMCEYFSIPKKIEYFLCVHFQFFYLCYLRFYRFVKNII